jgi:hypothetical protein
MVLVVQAYKLYKTIKFAFLPTKVKLREEPNNHDIIWLKKYDLFVSYDLLGNKYYQKYKRN